MGLLLSLFSTADCFCPTVSEGEPKAVGSTYFSSSNSKANSHYMYLLLCDCINESGPKESWEIFSSHSRNVII